MPDDLASSSLLISSGITLIAAFLGLRQWYEWRARDVGPLAIATAVYFFRQDVRRGLGVAVMLILAAGLYFGSRIPPQVAGHANLTFVQVWLAISRLDHRHARPGPARLDLHPSLRPPPTPRSRRRNDERILREASRKKHGDHTAESEHAVGLTCQARRSSNMNRIAAVAIGCHAIRGDCDESFVKNA